MKCFYSYINNENFGIHKILEFWSGKRISKTYCFHAKHLPWIKKRSWEEFLYLGMYGPSKIWLLNTNSHVTVFVNLFRNMWVIHDIAILPFVYYISIWPFAVDFFLYCLMKAIKDSHSFFFSFHALKKCFFQNFFFNV